MIKIVLTVFGVLFLFAICCVYQIVRYMSKMDWYSDISEEQ
jgi:hypothetical protein